MKNATESFKETVQKELKKVENTKKVKSPLNQNLYIM